MYVGALKMSPLSRIPRRLTIARASTSTTQTRTRWSYNCGKIEVRAATPAAMDTATVST